jgi:hypothetical protein
LDALAEVFLPVLVLEDFAAHVGALKLGNVEHLHDFPRDFARFERLLAQGTIVALGHPGLQTALAEEAFALGATHNVVDYHHADGTQKFLNNLGILRQHMGRRQLLKLLHLYCHLIFDVNLFDDFHGPDISKLLSVGHRWVRMLTHQLDILLCV